jgi:glycosyltransferase involved in cell wall biosynthesis
VNTIVYRLIGGKTGQLILNERNDVPKQTNFLIRILYRMILSEEIIILTNSLNSYNYFIKFHKNTKFVYNFYVNNKENSIANYNKILKTKDVSVLRTVNVGRFVNQKNQIDLIEKINNYDNKNLLYLDIIGRGVLKEKLNNFIINNNLKNINIVDHTNQQSNYTLKNYDILFINSKFEGQTNLILEAMNENIIIMINDILENELKTIYKNTNFEKIVYFYNSKNLNEILNKISNDKIKIKNNLSDEKEKFIKKYTNFENLTNLHLNIIN